MIIGDLGQELWEQDPVTDDAGRPGSVRAILAQ